MVGGGGKVIVVIARMKITRWAGGDGGSSLVNVPGDVAR